MSMRFPSAMAACLGAISIGSLAFAFDNVTTKACIARHLCAYVDTTGHVTCGPCPGQARSVLAMAWVLGKNAETTRSCEADWRALAPADKAKVNHADHAAYCFYHASSALADQSTGVTARCADGNWAVSKINVCSGRGEVYLLVKSNSQIKNQLKVEKAVQKMFEQWPKN